MANAEQGSQKPAQWAYAGRAKAQVGDGEKNAYGFTPEMRAVAEALTHPEGDPYDNARQMGFYCEQCG